MDNAECFIVLLLVWVFILLIVNTFSDQREHRKILAAITELKERDLR